MAGEFIVSRPFLEGAGAAQAGRSIAVERNDGIVVIQQENCQPARPVSISGRSSDNSAGRNAPMCQSSRNRHLHGAEPSRADDHSPARPGKSPSTQYLLYNFAANRMMSYMKGPMRTGTALHPGQRETSNAAA
jgi:hypothetical protein